MKYLVLLAMITLLLACGDDPFSTTVDIPLPEHDPLPVLTLDMRSGDTAIYYRVGLSRGILEENMPINTTADISVKLDDATVFTARQSLEETDGEVTQLFLPESISSEPGTYDIQVEIPGFDAITATQRMPSAPMVSNLDYTPDGAVDIEGFRVDEIAFDLQDDPATQDYYGVRVVTQSFSRRCSGDFGAGECDTIYSDNFFEVFIQSPDPTLKFGDGYGYVVSDATFSNACYRIRLTADNFNRGPQFLEVFHLTEDAYRYAISLDAYFGALDNPFAEPVNVHGNVENGYGHFILANRQRFLLSE